jgi:hypothetical protein
MNGEICCSKCGGETVFKEGVSKKTGNPYQGFKCKNCDNMDFIKDELGIRKEVKEVIRPHNSNGFNLDMRLSYRKDLMVAIVNRMETTTNTESIKTFFQELWTKIEG